MIRQQGKQKFKTGVRWLAWSGALALVSIGGWLVYILVLNRPAKPVAAPLLTVERGTIETTINESGTVELRAQQTLQSPTEGAVDQVLVQPGDTVKVGEVLVTLRYPERSTALMDQQVKIQQQQLTLSRNRQRIIEAQAQLKANEQQLQKLSALAREGAFAQQEVQQMESQVRDNRANLRDAQSEARIAALELQSLQIERQNIQQKLKESTLTAPIDGKVLNVKVKNGDGVEFRTELLTLGDPGQQLVKLQLSTLNATRVQPNQLARISIIGPGAQSLNGRVQSLYPQAITPETQGQNSRGGPSSQSGQARVPATVRLDTPTQTLIPGSQVNVEIVLKKRSNVVALNTEAIQHSGSLPFVWVRDRQGKAHKQTVTLGLEGLMTVEVTSGLRPGQQVILPPPEPPLKPGVPVIPETNN
jgi:HlyD family secretion protein